MNSMRLLRIEDINDIAKMHREALSGFLPELGEGFLGLFYEKSLEVPEMFTFISQIDANSNADSRGSKVVGFVTGVTTTKGLYKKILLKRPFWFGILLLQYIFTHPLKIIKIVQTLTYPGFTGNHAELLTLAVDKDFREQGIGRKLFQTVANEFKKRGIREFKISAYDRLPANGFYKKIGCKLERSFEFLDEKMNYYRYIINDYRL